MLKICVTVNNVGNLRKLNKSLVDGIRTPSVAGCEGLCGALAEEVASEDAEDAAG